VQQSKTPYRNVSSHIDSLGNEQSIIQRPDLTPTIPPAQQLHVLRRLGKRTHRSSNRGQQIYQRPGREHKKSCAANPWQHCFLDLPEAARVQVYAELLLATKIEITPAAVSKIPGVVLLRICKQIHEEAAAVLYARNTFHCCVRKLVPAQKVSVGSPQYPCIRAPFDVSALCDPLNITGGVFFPAAQYHAYRSHLSVRLELTVAHFNTMSSGSPMPLFTRPNAGTGFTQADMEKMHNAVQYKVIRVYQRIKSLWRDKDGASTGQIVIPEQTPWTSTLVYEIEFRMMANTATVERKSRHDEKSI
jgi:hypothetical protein